MKKAMTITQCTIAIAMGAFNLPVCAATPAVITVMPYAAQYNYADDTKSKLNLAGVYGYIGKDNHALELEYDHFSNDTTNPVEQNILGIYTNYSIPATRLRVGYHAADVKDGTDVKMALAGIEWDKYNTYGYKTYGLGLNYYGSKYSAITGNTFNVHQLSPSVNKYLSNPNAYSGFFNFILTDNIVYSSESINNKKVHNDVTLTTEYTTGKWLWTLFGSTGDAAFTVNNKGFVILNDTSVNDSTFGAGVKYQLTPKIAIKTDFETHHTTSLLTDSSSRYNKIFLGASYSF